MYHTIKLRGDWTADLEVSLQQALKQLRIYKGSRLIAQLKPAVVETPSGPVEAADLFFADGTITRSVPFDRFAFVDP